MKKGKRKISVGIAAAGLLLIGAAVSGLTLKARAQPEDEVIWREYRAEKGTITASLDGGGVLKGASSAYRAGMDVRLETIYVRKGQAVKKGDILAGFSMEAMKKLLKEKEAALESARRSLRDAENAITRAQLEKDLERLEKAETDRKQYENGRREKEKSIASQEVNKQQVIGRLSGLRKELEKQEETEGQGASVSGNTSSAAAALREQIRQLESELAAADNTISYLNEELESMEQEYRKQSEEGSWKQAAREKKDRLSLEALGSAADNARAEAARKSDDLEELKHLMEVPQLTARADGVVADIAAKEGCDIPKGGDILTISETGERAVRTQVLQEDIGDVEEGMMAEIQFSAFPDRVFKGRVSRKSLVPSEGTDGVAYEVELTLDQDEEGLLEGMTCGVKFIRKRVEDVLTLSNKAITLKDGRQTVILLLPDGTHQEREITTGFSDGRVSEIKSGLEEGDIVVVEG